MCVQQRFRSVYASAQSGRSLSFTPEETLGHWLPTERLSKTDQTARKCRLIWVFIGHTCQLVSFTGHKPIYGVTNAPTNGLMPLDTKCNSFCIRAIRNHAARSHILKTTSARTCFGVHSSAQSPPVNTK